MLGNIISAVGNIAGGLLGNQEKKKDRQMQKEFAQHGIRWKVDDAKAAGLHPLAALGANTVSYSPVSVGSDLSSGLAAAGQDIGRAVDATRTSGEKLDAYAKTVQDLNLRRMGLENELLSSQIAKLRTNGPAMPSASSETLIPGQGNALVKYEPLEVTASPSGRPSIEGGSIPDVGYSRTTTGHAPVPSEGVKNRIEDNVLQEALWAIRNNLVPSFSPDAYNPPNVGMNPDEYWVYSPLDQEYRKRSIAVRPRYGFRKWYQ